MTSPPTPHLHGACDTRIGIVGSDHADVASPARRCRGPPRRARSRPVGAGQTDQPSFRLAIESYRAVLLGQAFRPNLGWRAVSNHPLLRHGGNATHLLCRAVGLFQIVNRPGTPPEATSIAPDNSASFIMSGPLKTMNETLTSGYAQSGVLLEQVAVAHHVELRIAHAELLREAYLGHLRPGRGYSGQGHQREATHDTGEKPHDPSPPDPCLNHQGLPGAWQEGRGERGSGPGWRWPLGEVAEGRGFSAPLWRSGWRDGARGRQTNAGRRSDARRRHGP